MTNRLTQLPDAGRTYQTPTTGKVVLSLWVQEVSWASAYLRPVPVSLCHTERCNENQLILELQQVLLQWRILSRRNPNLLLWREIPLTSSMAISKSTLDVTGGQLLLFSRNVHLYIVLKRQSQTKINASGIKIYNQFIKVCHLNLGVSFSNLHY